MKVHAGTIGALLTVLALATTTAWARQSTGASMDDRLRADVEQRLLDRNIIGVTVSVRQRIVTLQGTAASAWMRNEACQTARKVWGFTVVTCAVSVSGALHDSVIASEVESRIHDYAFYTIYDSVDVTVKDGVVTLRGEVMTNATARAIAGLAAHTSGVIEVKNFIRTLVMSPNDNGIRYEIAARIYSNSAFAYEEVPASVHIIVEGGRVKLTGWVPSEFEKHLAERLASSVRGVTGVENRLGYFNDEIAP